MNKVTIVGTGPAGLTAAIYAARAQLAPVVYAGLQHGGQLTTTTEVENFPGFAHGIMGPNLMSEMTAQAERFGTKIVYDMVTKTDLSKPPFKLWVGNDVIETQTLIIATGATARTLGLPGESTLMGRGLSTCATCDGFFYRGRKVAVTGGGDSAMEEAMYLANLATEVYLIHRREQFRASPIMVERAQKNPRIKMMIPYVIEEPVVKDEVVAGLKLRHRDTGAIEEIEVDGLFMAIGHTPNSEVFKPWIETDEQGYVRVREFTKTNVEGVFAAGDISDPNFRQAITAAGMGCQAAIQAQRYLENLEASH